MNISVLFLYEHACFKTHSRRSTHLNSSHTFLIWHKLMHSFAQVLRLKVSLSSDSGQDEACDRTKSCFKPNESEQRRKHGCQSALVILLLGWVQHIPGLEPCFFPRKPRGLNDGLLSPVVWRTGSRSRSSADCAVSPRCWAPQLPQSAQSLSRAAFRLIYLSFYFILPAINFAHIERQRL